MWVQLRHLRQGIQCFILLIGAMGAFVAHGQTPPLPAPAAPLATQPSAAKLSSVPNNPASFIPRIAAHTAVSPHGSQYAVLTINEQEAVTLRTSTGGFNPIQRAAFAVQRLTRLVQQGIQATQVDAVPLAKPNWAVTIRGETFLLATSEEAAAHQTTPKLLAQLWVRTLRLLLLQPPLTVSSSALVVPLGQTRTVKVDGAVLPNDVEVQSDSSAIASVSFDPAQRTLTIKGNSVGDETVTVAPAPGVGGAPIPISISVMQYAGSCVPNVTMQVTGDPAPSELVTQAAYLGLAEALKLQNGAEISVSPVPELHSLPVADRATASFNVQMTGSDLLPVSAQPEILVNNSAVSMPPASALLYSNAPEQVKTAQTLYRSSVGSQETVRLDFHHQNLSGQLLVFHIELYNPDDTPATVQVIAGLSLPGADTVQVGRRAGAAFMNNLENNAGLILTVPPHTALPLMTQRFASGLTLSGIMQIHNISHSALALTITAQADLSDLAAPLWRTYMAGDGGEALAAPANDSAESVAGQPSAEVFSAPYIRLHGRYTVDGHWAFVAFGDKQALHSLSGALRLYGNYGADYEIKLTLVNPTPSARTVAVFFAPDAGTAAGVFQVDHGPIQEFDPFDPPAQRQLAQYVLAPGQTQIVHIHTIPLNGSSYPAQIVAYALDKLPVIPSPVLAAAAPASGVSSVAASPPAVISGKAK